MSLSSSLTGAAAAPVRPETNPIPRVLLYPLVVTLFMFQAANTFNSTFQTVNNLGKWAPLSALMVLGFATLAGRRMPEVPPAVLGWLIAFFALGTLGTIYGINDDGGMFSLFTVVLIVMTGYSVAAALVAADCRRAFFDLIANVGRILVVGALLFYLARFNLGRGGGFAAWVDNPNTLASMLAPGIVMFIAGCIERRPGWKVKHLAFLVVSLPLLWFTNGRASVIWVLFSICAFWLYRRGSWVTVLAAMAALIILVGWWEPISTSTAHFLQLDIDPRQAKGIGPLSGREEVWRIGMELFRERPILGYGIGSSKELLSAEAWRFVRFQGANFHSSYVMLLVETGAAGTIAFLGVLVATLIGGLRDARRTRMLPTESWPLAALPFVMVVGALGHATFEAWLVAAGNVNSPLLWTCVWLIHFQTGIPIRAKRHLPTPASRPAALPAR